MTSFAELDPQAARKLLSTESPLVLDARDAHSYRDAHIDGALLLHDDLLKSLIKKADHERPVLVYCDQGKSSAAQAQLLASAGYRRVYNLQGGFVAWRGLEQGASVQGNGSPT